MKYYSIIILIFVLFFNENGHSQNRFRGGIVGGFNAAQLDGDAAAGYHKVGLNGGLRALVELQGRFELLTEILYSQRGSRTTENESLVNRTCTLNYLEVPVLLNIRDWKKSAESGGDYYKVSLSIGLSYSRLFKASANDFFPHAAVVDKFSKSDVAFVGGLNFNANPHWVFSFRLSESMTKVFNPQKYINEPLAGGLPVLRGHYISFQTGWVF